MGNGYPAVTAFSIGLFLVLQACGSTDEMQITSFKCVYPNGLGVSGSSTASYDRGSALVTSQQSASDGNKSVWKLSGQCNEILKKELDLIDTKNLRSSCMSSPPATARDGGVVVLTFYNLEHSIATSVDTNDSSILPPGVGYVYKFCEGALFTKQGDLQ